MSLLPDSYHKLPSISHHLADPGEILHRNTLAKIGHVRMTLALTRNA